MSSLHYYGDVCKVCFREAEFTCSACNMISYCSRIHEIDDIPHHKLICNSLKTIQNHLKCIPSCSFEDFTEYRKKFKFELRKKIDTLSDFEEQVCAFPWVCAVCYSKENSFRCEKCRAVVYCSLEHKQKDSSKHGLSCENLKLCKIMDSLTYENGFVFVTKHLDLHLIPSTVKNFPNNIDEFSSLIQKKIQVDAINDLNERINYIRFNDSFAQAGTLLYALNKMGFIDKREFLFTPISTKSGCEPHTKEKLVPQLTSRKGKNPIIECDSQMIIHIVAASQMEILICWSAFEKVIKNWCVNVEFIHIFLVGQALKEIVLPDLKNFLVFSDIHVYPIDYKEVAKKLPKPNIVALCNYACFISGEEFSEKVSQRALFKHKSVPLVVTSADELKLKSLVEKLKDLPNVIVEFDTHKNPFPDARPYRTWEEKGPTTFTFNSFIAILRRN